MVLQYIKNGTLGIALVTLTTGCMITASTPSGIREFYRGQNGLVTTGKASPDKPDSYHDLQKTFESESTTRSIGRIEQATEQWGQK